MMIQGDSDHIFCLHNRRNKVPREDVEKHLGFLDSEVSKKGESVLGFKGKVDT